MTALVPVRTFQSGAEMMAFYANLRRAFNGPRKPRAAPLIIAPPLEPADAHVIAYHGAIAELRAENEVLREALAEREALRPEIIAGRATVAMIIRHVAIHRGLTANDVKSLRRTRAVIQPRQEAMYLASVMTTRSLPEIGRQFNRDHTTVLHGLRRIKAQCEASPEYAAEIASIREAIEARVIASMNARPTA